MFLVTTADRRYWKTDDKILFLGEWCKSFSERRYWEGMPHETMPFYWDDRERLYRDYLYVGALYEHYLGLLAQQLNYAHSTGFSLRYWRILVGPWLRVFIETLFDRYVAIKEAQATNRVNLTWVPKIKVGEWTANDFPEWLQWFVGDAYNQYLYGAVIRNLGVIPYEEAGGGSPAKIARNAGGFTSGMKWLLGICSRAIPDRFNKKVLVSSYLPLGAQIRLQLSLGQIPYFPPQILLKEAIYKQEQRSALHFGAGGGEFEVLLAKLLPDQIPRIYLEGYALTHRQALRAYPKKPELIFTANAYSQDEFFKFWAAYRTEIGTKLIISQHGGQYGAGLWSSTESHELKIADTYFSWGWRSKKNPHVEPHPAGKLSSLKKRDRAVTDGPILWVADTWPRFPCVHLSIPVASQMMLYLNEQKRFLEALSENASSLIMFRLHPTNYGWDEKIRWKEEFPQLHVYQGAERFSSQLRQCRLFVGTNNATTFLESLVADVPTIVFWSSAHSELRKSAIPHFDKLRNVGILHDSPESAAAKVNEVYWDPDSWWQKTEVQRARAAFCEQFALTREDWLSDWKRSFTKEIVSKARQP